jgi:hypothetical protein
MHQPNRELVEDRRRHRNGIDRGGVPISNTGTVEHGGGGTITLAETWAALVFGAGFVEGGTQILRPVLGADDVVTEVDAGAPGTVGVEEGIEGGHAICLGRGDGEPIADVCEGSPAHCAGGILHGVKSWKEKVTLRPRGMPSVHDPSVELLFRAQETVDGLTFGVGGPFEHETEVHAR